MGKCLGLSLGPQSRLAQGALMRKADYAALAAIIKESRDSAIRCANAATDTPLTAEAYKRQAQAIEAIARQFVKRASVDGVAFLGACGITP